MWPDHEHEFANHGLQVPHGQVYRAGRGGTLQRDVTGDVSEGVERHDLMEVDLVDLDTVDAGFGSRQRLEDSQGATPDGWLEFRRVHQLTNVASGARGALRSCNVTVIRLARSSARLHRRRRKNHRTEAPGRPGPGRTPTTGRRLSARRAAHRWLRRPARPATSPTPQPPSCPGCWLPLARTAGHPHPHPPQPGPDRLREARRATGKLATPDSISKRPTISIPRPSLTHPGSTVTGFNRNQRRRTCLARSLRPARSAGSAT